jgi:hypothetical protein
MHHATWSSNYEGVSWDTSIKSIASSRQAKASHQKNQKLPVGTIDKMTPLESVNVFSVVPKKVPPHPSACCICPPDLAKTSSQYYALCC